MKLTGARIHQEVLAGSIEIDPYDPKQLRSDSYDVRLSPHLLEVVGNADVHVGTTTFTQGGVDTALAPATRELEIPRDGLWLFPGRLYLGATMERFGSREFLPTLDGRSSTGRLGWAIHITAGRGDRGFLDTWTLELTVVLPLKVYRNMRIGQVYFEQVLDTDRPHPLAAQAVYNPASSKYADFASNRRPKPSRLHLEAGEWKEST